jgi:hypothetical protein
VAERVRSEAILGQRVISILASNVRVKGGIFQHKTFFLQSAAGKFSLNIEIERNYNFFYAPSFFLLQLMLK